jgi:hypothetical protein
MDNVHFIGGWWIIFFFLPFMFWRRSAWGRPDRRTTARQLELDESVRARLELVDQLESRVAELENRLDFTERLLADRKESNLGSR